MKKQSDLFPLAAIVGPFALLAVQKLFIAAAVAYFVFQ